MDPVQEGQWERGQAYLQRRVRGGPEHLRALAAEADDGVGQRLQVGRVVPAQHPHDQTTTRGLRTGCASIYSRTNELAIIAHEVRAEDQIEGGLRLRDRLGVAPVQLP